MRPPPSLSGCRRSTTQARAISQTCARRSPTTDSPHRSNTSPQCPAIACIKPSGFSLRVFVTAAHVPSLQSPAAACSKPSMFSPAAASISSQRSLAAAHKKLPEFSLIAATAAHTSSLLQSPANTCSKLSELSPAAAALTFEFPFHSSYQMIATVFAP